MNTFGASKAEIVNTIVDYFKYSRDYFDSYYRLCQIIKDLYNVELPSQIKENLSADFPGLMPPDIFNAVNDVVAHLDELLFPEQDIVWKASPEGRTPDVNARMATTYLEWSKRKSDLQLAFDKTLFSAARFGVGVGYVEIDTYRELKLTKSGKGTRNLSEGGEVVNMTDFVKGRTIHYPRYVPCNLLRYFPDPSVNRRNWGIYQSEASHLEIMEEYEKGEGGRYEFSPKELKEIKGHFPAGDFDTFFPNKKYKSEILKQNNYPVELLHFRGYLPIKPRRDSDKIHFVDCIATVANRKMLIQFELNEWHFPSADTFLHTCLFPPDEESMYPVSKSEASMDLLLQQFYIRNMRLQNLAYALNQSYWTTSKDFPDFIENEPGRVHQLKSGEEIQPLEQQDVTNKAYIEVDVLKDEIGFVFGSNDYSMGRDPRRKETAFGISVLNEATQRGRKFEHRMVVRTGLQKVGERYLEIGQLYHDELPMRMYDTDEIVLINRDTLFGEFAVSLDTVEAWTKPIQQQAMLKMVEIYKEDPFVDPIILRRKHFGIMGFPELKKLVPDPKLRYLHIEKENRQMVEFGIFVEVLPDEPDEVHLPIHAPYRANPMVAEHIEMHIANMQRKQGNQSSKPGPAPLGQPEVHVPENERDVMKQIGQELQPRMV